MEYVKRCQYKITRTEHRVQLSIGGMCMNLKKALSDIPLDAKLIDIEEDENDRMTLVFMVETTDEQA